MNWKSKLFENVWKRSLVKFGMILNIDNLQKQKLFLVCYSFIAFKHWVNFQKLFYPINKKLNAQCELKMRRIHFRICFRVFSGLLPVLVLDLGHGDSLEALGCHRVRLCEVVELLLAQVVNKSSADWVSQHVDGGSESKCKETKIGFDAWCNNNNSFCSPHYTNSIIYPELTITIILFESLC